MNNTLKTTLGITTIVFQCLVFQCLSQNDLTKSNNTNSSTMNMSISRTVEVPLEHIWNAWSNAESVKKWWGPQGFTAPVAKMEFKEGGVSLVCMRSPEGYEIYNTWTYTKILPMYGIEFIQHFADKDGNKLNPADIGLPPGIPNEVPHLLLFKDKGNGQTEINITEYGYLSAEVVEISKAGMEQVLDKQAKVLSEGYNKSSDSSIHQSIEINVSPSIVWQRLSQPEHIRTWLSGAAVTSEWKEGSPILFTGEWKGTKYVDKGMVMQFDPMKTFQYSYWSGFSGLPDEPKNYSIIRFDLRSIEGGKTKLILTHRNLATKQMYEHSKSNWEETLNLIKKIAEESAKQTSMNKYLLHGKVTAIAGHRDELTKLLIEASRLVSTAKGCRLYVIGKDKDDLNSVYVTEIWDSKQDHDNSLNVEGVKELIAKVIPIIDKEAPKIKGLELELVGGTGI